MTGVQTCALPISGTAAVTYGGGSVIVFVPAAAGTVSVNVPDVSPLSKIELIFIIPYSAAI